MTPAVRLPSATVRRAGEGGDVHDQHRVVLGGP